MKQKRGQAWGFDIFMAFSLFILGIITFIFFTYNYPNEGNEIVDVLTYEANFIADLFLSQGQPVDWNTATVIYPGVVTNGKINSTKLEQLYNLTQTDYNITRALFSTSNEYYITADVPFVIDQKNITVIGNNNTQNAENLIRVTRFTAYQNKPLTLYINVWN